MYLLIYASGNVQGVGFRASAKHFAEKKGIKGYAKNLSDGRVKLEVEGNQEDLRWFCESIETIPGDGNTALNIEETAVSDHFTNFEIL